MEEVDMSGKFKIFIAWLLLSLSVSAQEIKSVNFLQDGEVSKVIIEIDKDSFKAERFHITEDKQIILDLKNVKAPTKVLRDIDTSEFSGSVVFIKPYKKPGKDKDVRFAIQLRDNVRSILDVLPGKIVLNVENRFGVFSAASIKQADQSVANVNATDKKETESFNSKVHVPKSDSLEDILENLTMSGVKKYIGKRISINVRDIAIVDLLNIIAETSGFNVIIDKEVSSRPPLTISLTNIPWDEALDTVLSLSKLAAKKHTNILMVTTFENAQREREAELKNQQLNIKQEALMTKIFPVSYSTLGDLQNILKEYSTPERGRMSLDERTNSIIVKDTAEVIERMKKIIELLDTATPQILIEAKIVEAQEQYAKSIGLAGGLGFGYDPITPNPVDAGPGWSFNSASTNASGAPGNLLGVSIARQGSLTNLNFNLQLLESESKVRIVSSPKIITQNKKAATISNSDQTSFQTTTVSNGVTTAGFENVAANLNLTVTPQVTNEGSIAMQVNLTKSGFGARLTNTAPPNQTTRTITTNVLVDNGSTIVIGGLYSTESSESVSGIPFLKDLPLIGWLFRTPYNPTNKRNELIIFLTPRIINQEEAGLVDRETKIDT
jgi:type IV pilus assembly protein PilQ